jgi:bifunctional non-homologous end joining protein LigD
MLPHVANRPLALVRCPDGIGAQCFFQKHAGAGLPKAIREVRIGDRPEDAVLIIDSAEGLVSLVQRGVLEIHLWGSHLKTIEKPDLLVFDFDPDPTVKWPAVVQAAFEMRDFLAELGLKSFTKTTGGKGLHVVVPIRPMLEWDAVKEFTRLVSTRFSDLAPDRFLVNMSKAKRVGKIFVDYLRNGRGATAIAPYSTRSRPGAQIATPISWKELKDGAVPADFTVATVPRRIGKRFKDPWAEIASVKQAITVKMIKSLSD